MSMSVVVKKFGGTSVANIERIEFVADKIFQFYQQKQRVIVVVSAMKGETDKLESLAYQISDDPDPREMAALLSTGEQVVISLLAMALIKRGCPACSYTGLQLGIETDGMATKSKIKCINTQNIYQDLEASKVVIVAGFQGVDINNGNITTLGRGGSDTTAVALSIALNAKQCDIYTDVDGVYTADPNIVPSAKRLNEIKFHEMLELSGLGAKVMQIRAVELGSYYNMPIKVLSSFQEQDLGGTIISNIEKNIDINIDKQSHNSFSFNYNQIAKIASLTNQVKVCLINLKYKNLELLLNKFVDLQLEIDMFTSFINNSNLENLDLSDLNVSFVISHKNLKLCQKILKNLEILDNCINYIQIAKLSIVGLGLASDPVIISKIYSSLNSVGIKIHQIITSETKVSILLNEIDLELAIKTLHSVFLTATSANTLLNVC